MKIMIVSDLAPPVWGGAENYVVNLGSRLVELGHDVHWVTSKLPNTSNLEIMNGINIHRVPVIYPNRYFFPGRQSFFLTSLIPAIKLAKKMDIVQANSLVAGFSGWFIGKYAGKPSVLFCHELYGELWKTVGQNIFERNSYPLFEKSMARAPYDWFACPSEYSKSTLLKQGSPKDKITVIPHGIDFTRFNPNNDKNHRKIFNLENYLTIGFIGRLNLDKTTQAKNIQSLLKAIKLVSHEIPNAKLVLAGTGFEDLTPLIRDLGIQENVIYLGRIAQEEVQNFYSVCDVVACPALSDGFCFMLAEASACGIPTVATNLGSHPERIINERTGLLSGPTPDSIAQNIIRILKDKSLSEKLGHNAMEFVKDLTWDRTVKDHINLYTKLIQQAIK